LSEAAVQVAVKGRVFVHVLVEWVVLLTLLGMLGARPSTQSDADLLLTRDPSTRL
jgi:hypothetical protein